MAVPDSSPCPHCSQSLTHPYSSEFRCLKGSNQDASVVRTVRESFLQPQTVPSAVSRQTFQTYLYVSLCSAVTRQHRLVRKQLSQSLSLSLTKLVRQFRQLASRDRETTGDPRLNLATTGVIKTGVAPALGVIHFGLC